VTSLRISPDLELPLDFITSTMAILAQKRKGKTYLAQVYAEELSAAGQPWAAIDPTGAWWGIRASADGKAPGFPVVVIGGDHGDVPLEPGAGAELAEAIAAEHFSCVIDTTLLRKGQALRFCADFLEALYLRNREAMHLFIDEADLLAPQIARGVDDARALGATQDIVRRGGIRGIGTTLITQRSQVLNKDVLSQVDSLAVLRLTHPKDIAPIEDWIAVHADRAQASELLKSLPRLDIGDGWYWAPHAGVMKRIRARKKITFDSGRTPKPGERLAPPKVLAAVDIAQLGERMTAAVVRAKENDPKALRAEVLRLRQEVEQARATPAVTPEQLRELDRLRKVESLFGRFREAMRSHAADLSRAVDADTFTVEMSREVRAAPPPSVERAIATGRGFASPEAMRATATITKRATPPAGVNVTGPMQKIVDALAWFAKLGIDAPELPPLAFLAGYSSDSSSFEKARGALRVAELVEYPTSGCTRLTPLGASIASPTDVPRTNAGLQAAVLAKLPGPAAKLLRVLLEAGRSVSLDELAKASGYSVDSSSLEKARGRLRTLGLAEYPVTGYTRAADILFPEGRR
jgi:hypothetical protein